VANDDSNTTRSTPNSNNNYAKGTFKDYIKYFWFCVLGSYSEYLGAELQTFLIGINGDLNIMAAWIAIQNLMCITFSIGNGLSDSMHHYCTCNIAKCPLESKRLAIYSLIYSIILGIFIMPIWIFGKNEIASLFIDITQAKEAHAWLSFYTMLYGNISWVD